MNANKLKQQKKSIFIPLLFSFCFLLPSFNANAKIAKSRQWVEHKIIKGDNLAKIYRAFDFSIPEMHKMLRQGKSFRRLSKLKINQKLRFRLDKKGQPKEVQLILSPIKRLIVKKNKKGRYYFTEKKEKLDTIIETTTGLIRTSLFGAADEAGLTSRQVMQLVKIFASDIDFALQIHEGDTFSVVYEAQYFKGRKHKNGAILAAEFNLHGKVYQAVRYKYKGETAYYSPTGKGKRGLFLRTPLNFTRISSHFSKRRWHPKLKRWRAHHGVDYAAPTGTPVRATGNGKITFRGRKGGYGRVIYIKHKGKYTTVYAHLSRYAKAARKGRKVKQGQIIGYVGSSGLATGPHLHYEFRIYDKHQNPEKINFASTNNLSRSALPRFKKKTRPLLGQLKKLRTGMLALSKLHHINR